MLSLSPGAASTPNAPQGWALLRLGFRPFYLLASLYAALAAPLWAAQYAGLLPGAVVNGPIWHAHEMLLGFTFAVITGFLFTAVRNWTGQPTPTGALLGAYVLLWLAGRIAVYTPWLALSAALNTAFPLAVAAAIGVPLLKSGNRRNLFLLLLLCGLALVSLAIHLQALQVWEIPQLGSARVGLDLVLFIMVVMAGRVVPMFTNNALPQADARRLPLVERAAILGILLLLLADLSGRDGPPLAVLAAAVAVPHAIRLALWHPWRTGAAPLVWILHAAYAWIVLHLLMRSLAALGLLAEPLAVHALTVGAIGSLTLGMMARTARGHTGRPLSVGGMELAAFLLIQLAALLRVAGGWIAGPSTYPATVLAASSAWSLAFALYAGRYLPVLARPRLDGKPG
jgi:uncharacterized protein involved in response to NO